MENITFKLQKEVKSPLYQQRPGEGRVPHISGNHRKSILQALR